MSWRSLPILLVTALALSACASASGSAGSDGPRAPDRWVMGGGEAVQLQLEKSATSTSIVLPESPDDVFRAVVRAYQELGIPITSIDEPGGMVGNPEFRLTRRFGGRRLSAMLNCGTAPGGAPAADHYQVELDISTRAEPVAADTTRVTTRLSAWARNPSGSSSSTRRCGTRGVLEQGLLKQVYVELYGGS